MRWYKGNLLVAVLAALLAAAPALAVHDLELFELEGDIVDGAPTGEDWVTLYDSGANTGGTSLKFTGILPDPNHSDPADAEDIFVGGRKDIQDIGKWGWKEAAGFPDKNDITNAYAAAYSHQCQGGDPLCLGGSEDQLIIYFGADRFSSTGDAFLGFWFFKETITADAATHTFDGKHTQGDVLVLVNYPQGTNAVPEIEALEWTEVEAEMDAGKNLHLLYSSSANGAGNPLCNGGNDDPVCAITNDSAINPSVWPYTPKSGPDNVIPFESFFEGGINITYLLGETPCFTSFMAETRSSRSITATLKDFVLAEFDVCGITVTKECSLQIQEPPGAKLFRVDFSGTVTNTGALTIPQGMTLKITDDCGTPTVPGDDVEKEYILPNSVPPGGTFDFDSVDFANKCYTDETSLTNSVTATLENGFIIAADLPGTATCGLTVGTGIDVVKDCSPPGAGTELVLIGGAVAVKVNYSADVCNTGDTYLEIATGVSHFPDNVHTFTITGNTRLAPFGKAGNCAIINGSYRPTAVDSGETCPGNAYFTDTLTVAGTPVNSVGTPLNLSGPDPADSDGATCPLCFTCPP